jgi:hypothetical protein
MITVVTEVTEEQGVRAPRHDDCRDGGGARV